MRHSTHVHSGACKGCTFQNSLWAPPRTTKEHCVTTCHVETSQKTTNVLFFKKSPYWNSMRSRDVISKTTSKQNRMELPLVVSTSSLSECPVLKKKRVPQYHLKNSTCAWLKLQSPTHPFHTTAHTRGENMGLSQSAGVSNVFSASTGPTFDQPHSVEWC